ncbi:hypothetical protein ACNQFZ_02190 [Schinkia sp. CFF1]
MSRELEGYFYFGVMGLVIVAVIIFTVLRMKKTGNFGKTWTQSIVLSFLLFFLTSIWWFFVINDGFSQVVGVWIYGAAFIVNSLVNAVILFFMKY